MIKKEIIEISVEVGELELEYRKLAQEGVEWLDNVSTVFDSTFNEIKNEAEAQQFAISEFKRIDWMEEYEGEEDLPEDFKPRLLEEIKKEFVSKVLGFWQEYKMHYEN